MNRLNPFFERSYTCPICMMKFNSLAIRSSAVYVEKRETDFHSIYRGINPLHYSIIVCPVCKYAASNNLFSQELPVATVNQLSLALAQFSSGTNDFTRERDLNTSLESFKMAIRSAQLKKSSPGELAGLLLAAGWICREAEMAEQENYYLDEALRYYQLAFEKSSSHIGNLTDVQVAYLIGELNLRRGNYGEAISWFNKTITHRNIKTNPAVEKQARDQWQIAREFSKEQKTNVSLADQGQAQTVKAATAASSPVPRPAQTNRSRTTMQMMSNLYRDQIDWLNQIVNRGYDGSKSLVTKEQVLRSLLDACKEYLDGQIPTNFSNEAELKTRWLELLNKENS